MTNPPPAGAKAAHFGDIYNEGPIRLSILGFVDRLSVEAARWQKAGPIKPTPIFSGDDPLVVAILNHVDSFLTGLGKKASQAGKTQLANWRANQNDPGSDTTRIQAYTTEISNLLQTGF